jgi:hypothetical protein
MILLSKSRAHALGKKESATAVHPDRVLRSPIASIEEGAPKARPLN